MKKHRAYMMVTLFIIITFILNSSIAIDYSANALRPQSAISSAIRLKAEEFSSAMHREKLNKALTELLNHPGAGATALHANYADELYYIQQADDPFIKNELLPEVSSGEFNLIIIDSMRERFMQFGVPDDIFIHAGRGKDRKSRNIYIDSDDFQTLKRFGKKGAFILARAVEHEICHMNNPRLPESEVEAKAPSQIVKDFFALTLVIDGFINEENRKEQVAKILNILCKKSAFTQIEGVSLRIEALKCRAEVLASPARSDASTKECLKRLFLSLIFRAYLKDIEWANKNRDFLAKLKKGFIEGRLDVAQYDPLGINTLRNIIKWCGPDYCDKDYGDARDYIAKFVEAGEDQDWAELRSAFYVRTAFGTAGRRGLMFTDHSLKRLGEITINKKTQPICMPGPNRLNIWTVHETALMLASYLTKHKDDKEVVNAENPGLVYIGYDVRYNSEEFAQEIARVLSGCNFDVKLFDRSCSISELAWKTRYANATAGFYVTASHNPRQYSGIKVEGKNGGQISASYAEGIINEIGYPPLSNLPGLVSREALENEVDIVDTEAAEAEYINFMVGQERFTRNAGLLKEFAPRILVDPLCGTGAHLVKKTLEAAGIDESRILDSVSEHMKPDSSFAGLLRPDPSNKAAFRAAVAHAKNIEDAEARAGNSEGLIDAIILTDPDCDRACVVTKNLDGYWQALSANLMWSLITWAEVRQEQQNSGKAGGVDSPKQSTIVKSGVSTAMIDKIAEKYGCNLINTAPGFAAVGPEMMASGRGFGFEDSYGMSMSGHIPEKDAALAAVKIAETISYAKSMNRSLYMLLLDMYRDVGVYVANLPDPYAESDKSFTDTPEGFKAIDHIVSMLNNSPPQKIGDSRINEQRMQDAHARAKTINAICLPYGRSTMVTIRKSGTEPKVKIYFENIAKVDPESTDREVAELVSRENFFLQSFNAQFQASLFIDAIVSRGGLIFDVDDTLAPRNEPIPTPTIDRLIFLLARGMNIGISSGHSFDEASFIELKATGSMGVKERVVDGIENRFNELKAIAQGSNANKTRNALEILGGPETSLSDILRKIVIYANDATQRYRYDDIAGRFMEDVFWRKGFIEDGHKDFVINGVPELLKDLSKGDSLSLRVKDFLANNQAIIVDRQTRVTFAYDALKSNPDSIEMRTQICDKLNEHFRKKDMPIEAAASGKTTIGISRIGTDKFMSVDNFVRVCQIPHELVFYFGDEFYPSGNDFSVLQLSEYITVINVKAGESKSPKATNVQGDIQATLQLLGLVTDIYKRNIAACTESPCLNAFKSILSSLYFREHALPVNFNLWEFEDNAQGAVLSNLFHKSVKAKITETGFVTSESAQPAQRSSFLDALWQEPIIDIDGLKPRIYESLAHILLNAARIYHPTRLKLPRNIAPQIAGAAEDLSAALELYAKGSLDKQEFKAAINTQGRLLGAIISGLCNNDRVVILSVTQITALILDKALKQVKDLVPPMGISGQDTVVLQAISPMQEELPKAKPVLPDTPGVLNGERAMLYHA